VSERFYSPGPEVLPLQQERVIVNTPESVGLELELAGLGSRFLAIVIDTLLQLLVLAVIVLVAVVTGWIDQGIAAEVSRAADTTWGAALLFLIGWLLFYFYFLVFEVAWQGQTPGKRLMGVRVVDRSGRPAGAGALVVRNLVRLIDSLPVGYPTGVISFVSTHLGQRLGDLAAGTIVVRERRLRLPAPEVVPGGRFRRPGMEPPDATLIAELVHLVRPAERDLLRSFLARRKALNWSARSTLARRLATLLAIRMRYAGDLRYPEPFLEAIYLAARRG
jgi:uncharacterized RDD family membrane protein YckC